MSKMMPGEPGLPAGYLAVMKAMVATLTQQGFAAKGSGSSKDSGGGSGTGGKCDFSQIICHTCKKKGHMSHDCPDKKSGDANKAKGSSNAPGAYNIAWKQVLQVGAKMPPLLQLRKGSINTNGAPSAIMAKLCLCTILPTRIMCGPSVRRSMEAVVELLRQLWPLLSELIQMILSTLAVLNGSM
jgi:hypothetical protein